MELEPIFNIMRGWGGRRKGATALIIVGVGRDSGCHGWVGWDSTLYAGPFCLLKF